MAFGCNVAYAQIVKIYRKTDAGAGRYSPPYVTETKRITIQGNPVKADICTSHVDRQNLTMWMQMRRFTRLTNAFSKKKENLEAAVSLHFAHYNFCRIHKTLKVTPAMEAGITDHVWSIDELLLAEAKPSLAAGSSHQGAYKVIIIIITFNVKPILGLKPIFGLISGILLCIVDSGGCHDTRRELLRLRVRSL